MMERRVGVGGRWAVGGGWEDVGGSQVGRAVTVEESAAVVGDRPAG